jgi:ribosome-binding ATPase YchF (GTP1/OBG family)
MRKLRVGIVGPCAAGKSTLFAGLKETDLQIHHIAQEHSYVPDMWKRIVKPDILIYLHVSYPSTIQRKNLSWNKKEYEEQLRRLKHAYAHANLVIDTDDLSAEEVLQKVRDFIQPLIVNNIENPDQL